MKPAVPQPMEGGPEPDPKPVTTVPGRLRGLSGQYVAGAGDGDGGARGDRGDGDGGYSRDGVRKPDVMEGWTVVESRRKSRNVVQHVDVDMMQFVQDVNKLSWQKSGGQAMGPRGAPTRYCPLCSTGAAVCLGSSCLGKPPPVSTTQHTTLTAAMKLATNVMLSEFVSTKR